jgi:hypothetical protein
MAYCPGPRSHTGSRSLAGQMGSLWLQGDWGVLANMGSLQAYRSAAGSAVGHVCSQLFTTLSGASLQGLPVPRNWQRLTVQLDGWGVTALSSQGATRACLEAGSWPQEQSKRAPTRHEWPRRDRLSSPQDSVAPWGLLWFPLHLQLSLLLGRQFHPYRTQHSGVYLSVESFTLGT